MRHRIYEIIGVAGSNDILSEIYDFFMMAIIFLSLIPLGFKGTHPFFDFIEAIVVPVFILDYLLRWITADFKTNKTTARTFLLYPLTPMAIVDLISILPFLIGFAKGLKLLRLLRLFRTFRAFRVFKLFRYSKNVKMIFNVLREQRAALLSVLFLALGYILISALIVFNVEPDSFENFYEAIYWATVSLTTMGYNDVHPVTVIGRSFTMLSSLLGIAIIALPAAIITAGYLSELAESNVLNEDELHKFL